MSCNCPLCFGYISRLPRLTLNKERKEGTAEHWAAGKGSGTLQEQSQLTPAVTRGHPWGWIGLEKSVVFAKGIFSVAAAIALFHSTVLLSVCLSVGCTVHKHGPRGCCLQSRSLRLPPAPRHFCVLLSPPAMTSPCYPHHSFLFFYFILFSLLWSSPVCIKSAL